MLPWAMLLLLLLLWQLLRPPATVIDGGRGRAEDMSSRKGPFLGTKTTKRSHFARLKNSNVTVLCYLESNVGA